MTIIKRGFDKPTTLLASDAAKAANASRRSGLLASSLAGVIWLALCLVVLGISSKKIDSVFAYSKPLVYISYKEYALIKIESPKQHKCLCILWGKESAWNPKAVGNLTGKQQVYGIPQGKSEYLKTATPWQQVDWGLDYIHNKFGLDESGYTNACKALEYWKIKGWY